MAPPARAGFGSTVLTTMVERALGAEVELDYRASGVTWRLACPAPAALDARSHAAAAAR